MPFLEKSFKKRVELLSSASRELRYMLYFAHENESKIKPYYSNRDFLIFPHLFHEKKEKQHETSLHHALSKAAFDLLIELSAFEEENPNNSFQIRSVGVDLLQSFLVTSQISKTGEILENYIKFHIDEHNFKNRFYPALTRYMIVIFGLYALKEEKNLMDRLRIHLINTLKTKFHSLYVSDKEFALNLLPEDVSYNPENKILTEIVQSRSQNNRTLQCD